MAFSHSIQFNLAAKAERPHQQQSRNNSMLSINIFEVAGDASSHVAAYNWPNQPLPAGRVVGQQGNALLLELANGNGVAVISAPAPASPLQMKVCRLWILIGLSSRGTPCEPLNCEK
jgi:hypothetical protein